jgi:hypothetical protein
MSAKTTIYDTLAHDTTLNGMLARHKYSASKPAIYEAWAGEDAIMPYLNLTYIESESEDHLSKRSCSVNIDVWTEGGTIEAEAIRNQVISLLKGNIIDDSDDRYIRLYLDGDFLTDEDEPNVTHWQIEFTAIFWREVYRP